MTIFSNNPQIEFQKLNSKKNQVVIGDWNQYNSGGCHLKSKKYYSCPDKQTWSSNPRYLVTFQDRELTSEVIVKSNVLIASQICHCRIQLEN